MIELETSRLQCSYLPFEDIAANVKQSERRALGMLCFSSLPLELLTLDSCMPFTRISMPSLDVDGGVNSACEVWCADGDIHFGQHDAIHFGHNNDILFGAIQLSEQAPGANGQRNTHITPLQDAAETAYRAIFSLTDALKFPNILRFWNYIADINGKSHGMERYHQFNSGRQDGFLVSGREVSGHAVPAASAVGCDAGPLTIYFLASRGPQPIAIENPRQISAYEYPPDYGPRSPTFSRASVVRVGNDDVLFLSGTASIVGHRTLHAGDVLAQTRETIINIMTMVAEANRVAPEANFTVGDLCYKVYVRHEKDVAAIHGELRRGLGEAARLMYLRADICRQDLLLEIEAMAGYPFSLALAA